MPRRVDPDQRRAQIVDAYLRIVARSGVAAATSRVLADEAGIAAGALWHYFGGFDEVVRAAFERVYRESDARIQAALEGRRGLDAVRAMIREIVPHDAQTRNEATVVVSFWGLLPAHEEFRELTRGVERAWGEGMARHLDEAVADGDLDAATPVRGLADAVLAVCEALQLRQVQASPLARAPRREEMLAQLLAGWRRAP
ncbi:TetR/AcrR family transcriptional regulator [Microbacterium protaetiae]|uniref:TetR/AcrR family transcriptional regulator n=1 Tax=Microbacterium protaetiae TaxID=2509458 RepID=A0A4P6E9S5_9MICO|nr:TetR/AcrR family transcriptional regulator [Microbacterium protaetiae]QAY58872.1 TetR/AcrR family transcriptional regulator [Microbacterium protaetiae]